jgi:membrane-associated phospholipid phosphatase
LSNPFFNLDRSISRVLNEWGAREIFLVKVFSEYLVFAVIAVSLAWLTYRVYQRNKPLVDFKHYVKDLLLQGMTLLVIPVGVATVISEIISSLYVRQRPFVAMSDLKLLVPHGADGGMPSHHMVFMMSIAGMVYSFNNRLSILLVALSLISGIARISAGIHYPSDVLAGILLAGITTYSYLLLTRRLLRRISYERFGGNKGVLDFFESDLTHNNVVSGL